MSEPVVTVKQGDVRGAETTSVIGGSYISFKGIPYAAAPVGDLRFRDPEPPQPWTGVRDSFTEGSKCAQLDMYTDAIIGDDDCLYLNVATTSLTGSRPVMVWIHGGAFIVGDGGADMYGPDYIIGSDIVYVSINYRVGVLGFLNLDHELAPGNAGLKDQVAALKWVEENIAQFGGDPNNVTIFGESAGGASVHYLLLSPLAKGLFHKAIMQSGVVLNPFASVSETLATARRYVAALGKDITDPTEILDYLRTIPVHRLIEVQENMTTLEERIHYLLPFGPSVDDKCVRPFMPRPHRELVAEGFDIPIIIGYNSDEGILFLAGCEVETYTKFDENFEMLIARYVAPKAQSKVPEIAREIRKFYFGGQRLNKNLVEEYVQFCGDLHFTTGIHKVVEIQRGKESPTYLYRFSYDSPDSIIKTFFRVKAKGTMHAEENQHIFFPKKFREFIKIKPGSTEEKLRQRFVRMWTDFAKTGSPTPSIDNLITEKWEPVTKTTKKYLEINAGLSAGVDPDADMWETWKLIHAMVENE